MIQPNHRFKIIGFFVLLLIVDWFLYFRHAGHFFQGDTIFLLNNRADSVLEYLKEFVKLNPSGWYRPLTNELFESILYPLAGLNPVPYRIPVYVVFIAITIAVYALALSLTRRHLAAAIAAFFFTIHTTNAYTTYDLGFMPELLYAILYVAATLAYLQYAQNGSKTAYRLSLACFVASLLSKEAAVTLPAVLLVVGIILGPGSLSRGERLIRAIRSTAPHLLILVSYLAFAVGYLQIQSFSVSKLFDQSYIPADGDYVPVLNGRVMKNADLALTWAFNIPRGPWGQWQRLQPAMVAYLKFFRVMVFALMALWLMRSERKVILFGSAWFWITLLPALPLVSHFVPYYLFLPVIGLSLVVGVIFAGLHDWLRRLQPLLSGVAITLVFAGLLFVTSRSIEGDIRDNDLLGASSRLASNTLNDLKRMYPALPAEATLYFADSGQPLTWQHDFGGLIKMAYATDKISVLYQSQGDSLIPEMQNVHVFDVRDGRLVDETGSYLTKPAKFMKFAESHLGLELWPADVTAGRDKYTLRIKQASDVLASFAYTLNDGPLETFAAKLDVEGKVTLAVSLHTRKGVYRFWGFKIPDAEAWVRTEQTVTVR